jgi:hypothetical protein
MKFKQFLNQIYSSKREKKEKFFLVILFNLNSQIDSFFQVIQKLVFFIVRQIDTEYAQFGFDRLKLFHIQIVHVIFEYLKETIVREVVERETKSEEILKNLVAIERFEVSYMLENELGENRFHGLWNHLIFNQMVFHCHI